MTFKLAILIGSVFFICGNAYSASAPPVISPDRGEVLETLRDLEQKMRRIEYMQTGFTQIKKLSAFKHDIELKGSITMQKPDRFAWHTESPVRYSMVFEKGSVYQWNEDTNRVEVTALSSAPVLRIVMEQMQTWFSGSYVSLMDQYDIRILSKSPLSLEFVPRKTSFSFGLIQSLIIRFQADSSYIQAIEVEEENGDRSKMNFTDTVLNKEPNPSVWKADGHAV